MLFLKHVFDVILGLFSLAILAYIIFLIGWVYFYQRAKYEIKKEHNGEKK